MLKKTFIGVLAVALLSTILIAGLNFAATKAVNYSSSGTTVGGIIWENTTWTLENSPYIITDTVQIPENVTLTIEPGVTVTRPTSGDMFLLHGTVYAHGTINNEIVFDGGGNSEFFTTWGGAGNAYLDYCIIRNGYRFWNGGGYFNLTHSELTNLTHEISLQSPSADICIEYNKFVNTGGLHAYQAAGRFCKIYVRYNLFQKLSSSIHNAGGSPGLNEMIVKYNSFIDVDGIILSLGLDFDTAVMNATENYWGTLDTNAIDSKIYDRNDDIRIKNYIDYLPILTEPHSDTPTLPLIVNFTYSPSIPYVHGTVTFDASASCGLYSSIANFTWNFGDGNITVTDNPIISHTYTLTSNYSVMLTVTDEFGFKNTTTKSISVLQDYASPTTVDDYNEEWHNADFILTLTATDHESGIAETYYRINDGSVKAVSVDGQPLITTEGANNTLEYWSVDNAGNEELPHKILTGIKLDKTAPIIGIPSHIPEGDVQPNQEVKISVNVTDFMSGIKSVRIIYTSNRSTLWLNFPMTYNSTTDLWEFAIPRQQAGTLVKYEIEAYDNALNQKIDDHSGQYYVYTVIPEFPIIALLPLFIIMTTLVAIFWSKKLRR